MQVATENEEPITKKIKPIEADDDEKDVANGNQTPSKENSKPPEPPKDYIHVRARRGQATDSHSLAERVLPPFVQTVSPLLILAFNQ